MRGASAVAHVVFIGQEGNRRPGYSSTGLFYGKASNGEKSYPYCV